MFDPINAIAQSNILLIDDDIDILDAYQDLLKQEGYIVATIADPDENLIQHIPQNWQGIILCDMLLPHISGFTLLSQFSQLDPQIPVIMITGHGDVPMAVEAVKKGAFDFMEKPVEPEKLLAKVDIALTQRKEIITKRLWQLSVLNEQFIGCSTWIKEFKQRLQKLADTDIPIFLWGEIGTGRQLAATYLHKLSQKQQEPLIFHECLTMQKNELSQLVEQVKHGTLVLKNIHHLSEVEQTLLAELQRRDRRHFRLIVISDESLTYFIQQHAIVPLLYSLFSHSQVNIVPLRERAIDIPDIFTHYVSQASQRLKREIVPIKNKFLQSLMHKEWNGNIRELANMAEMYVIGLLTPAAPTNKIAITNKENRSLEEQLAMYEKKLIEDALIAYQGRVNDAAISLNIPRKTLYLRMKKYGLDKKHYKIESDNINYNIDV